MEIHDGTALVTVPIRGDGEVGESTALVIMSPKALIARGAINKFRSMVRKTGEFAIDTETSGLLWYRHKIVMVQVFAADPDTGDYSNLVFPFYWGSDVHPQEDMVWLVELINTGYRMFMWNAKFDMHFLSQLGPVNYDNAEIVDGLVISQMTAPKDFAPSDLKSRAREDLGYDMVDFTDEFTLGKTKTLLHYGLEEVVKYAAKDPIATFYECKHLLAKLEEPHNRRVGKLYHSVEKPLTKVLYDMETTGMVIDTGRVEELYTEYSAKQAAAVSAIYAAAGRTFNVQAQAQFCDAMVEHGFPAHKFRLTGKSKKRQLDEKAVEHYIEISAKKKLTRCLAMLAAKQEYAAVQKLVSTYIIPIRGCPTKIYASNGNVDKKTGEVKFTWSEPIVQKCADGYFRIFPSFNQTKARTGRMSCDQPNAQNWPRPNKKDPFNDGRIRDCVIAPRDYTLGDLDYSQIELRILGHASGEKRFIHAYKHGLDLHRIQVSRLLKKRPEDVTDEERQIGKVTTSFGVIYGMHYKTLAREHLGGDVEFAERVINDFYAENPRVHRFKLMTERFARKNGYVETLCGRRRYLDGAKSADEWRQNAAMREAVNTVIQGSAADFVKLAMIRCHRSKWMREHGIKMLAQIHDELIFQIPLWVVDKYGDEYVILKIRDVMENFKASRKLKCPLKAEGGFGSSWYDAH